MVFAARTSPFTIRQPQALIDASAPTTGLTTRIEPVNLDYGSPVPFRFVLHSETILRKFFAVRFLSYLTKRHSTSRGSRSLAHRLHPLP